MFKAILKAFFLLALVTLLVTCNNYEFPKSPYPKVETLPVANISTSGLTFQGSISQLATLPVIDHGFVWGADKNLSLTDDFKVHLGAASSLGTFEAEIKSGLVQGNTYFVKAFVATEDYFVFGEVESFISQGGTAPVIDSFVPAAGTWGDTIAIHGNYFGTAPGSNAVKFGSLDAKVLSSTETIIKCVVPANLVVLSIPISVRVAGKTTISAKSFQLTVPIIDNVSPTTGTFQDEVIITGSNFGAIKSHVVTVGGHPAEIVASSRTSLKVKIPVEVILKTNEIKLTLNQKTTTASQYFNILPPAIASISKTEGRVGDEVDITGDNFNPRLLGNLVLVGESQATVISATRNLVRAKLTNGVYPQRITTVKVTVAEQTALAGSSFKLLDVWLKKGYTPLAEVNSGGFSIDNIGYFFAVPHTYRYDPLANTWTKKRNFPGPFRLSAITFAADGEGFLGAGERGCCGGESLRDLWRYSPSTDTWSSRNDIPVESLGFNGTGIGTKGYTVQGFGPTHMNEYDPGSDSWTTIGDVLNANFTGYPHFPFTISSMDNRIFVFFRDQYNYYSEDNYLYEFDVATGKWTRRGAYFDERSEVFSLNGTGYIAGFRSLHEYDLTTNAITLNAFPYNNNNYAGGEFLFTANNKAYFLGAWANSQFELWEFDPAYK
jgi:hypothetical protein